MKLIYTTSNEDHMENIGIFLITTFAVILPISTTFWIIYALFFDANEVPSSPTRWLLATTFPIFVAAMGLKKKSLDWSGALAGLLVGFILTYSSYYFLITLLVFFLTSSKATKFRSHLKKKIENEYKDGGQRNWVQVLCNGGMATELALIYMIDQGCGERIIDFTSDYRGSWLTIGIVASLSCCNGDTWASELGTVFGTSPPYLITSWKPVPKGTNGGVSAFGLFFSATGGFIIGLSYYCCLLVSVDQSELEVSSPQWPILIVATFAGLFGSVLDSILGATLQYSGVDKKTGRVVNFPAAGVNHVAGLSVLDNHSINLISSVITGLIVPKLAVHLWEFF